MFKLCTYPVSINQMLNIIVEKNGRVYSYSRSDTGKRLLDKLKLKVTVFGELIQKLFITRFAKIFFTMLAKGVLVVAAMPSLSWSSCLLFKCWKVLS